MKFEKSWWTYNAIWWAGTGVLSLFGSSVTSTKLGLALLNILVGVALYKKSTIVFWIVFALVGVNFVVNFIDQASNLEYFGTLTFWLMLVPLILFAMLWQEIKNSKEKSK